MASFFQEPIISLILLHLLGGVCLLLWSTRFINYNIMQHFGGELRNVLSYSTKNRIKSFLTGLGVTALTQSSTTTILMTSNFLDKKMIGLAAALTVTIGADLSTTIIAQILTFDLSWLSPALLAGGLFLSSKSRTKTAAIGQCFIALGLALLALTLIREASEPLKDSELLVEILESLQQDPVFAVLFAAALTYVLHSSLATVLFFASLAGQGVLALDLSLYLILGANLGSSLVPFVATYKDGTEKRRLTVGNIIMKVCCVALLWFLLPFCVEQLNAFTDDRARQVVIAHTGFSVVLAVLFLPLVTPMKHLMIKLIPNTPNKEGDENGILYLDENSMGRPSVMLAAATRETLRMADLIETMLIKAFNAIKDNDALLLEEARVTDTLIDRIFRTIKDHLTQLDHDQLTAKEEVQYDAILSFSTHLEHCGDVMQHSMSKTIEKRINSKDMFSPEGWGEIKGFYKTVVANIETAQSVFISRSVELAEEMIRTKKELKRIELESRRNHFNRLSRRLPQTLATSDIHIDLMRDLGRINAYLTSVAYDTLNQEETAAE